MWAQVHVSKGTRVGIHVYIPSTHARTASQVTADKNGSCGLPGTTLPMKGESQAAPAFLPWGKPPSQDQVG